MKKIITALLAILIIYSCSGSSQNNQAHSFARPALNASTDLRLGQLSNSASPVAVSATLQNGESISIFTNSSSLADSFDLIFVTPDAQTIFIRTDYSGRPSTLKINDSVISYSNYTKEDTVDISIQTSDTNRRTKTIFLQNQKVNKTALDFLNSDLFLSILLGLDQDIDSIFRNLLAASIGALRLTTCSDDLTTVIDQKTLTNICNSDLIKRIEEILSFSGYDSITVNLTDKHPECDSPVTYQELSSCALVLWEELVEATKLGIVGDYPRVSHGGGNSSGDSSNSGGSGTTNGGTTSGGSSGGTTNGGSTNGGSSGGSNGAFFLGKWAGGGGGGGFSSCVGENFDANFDISPGNDNQCIMSPCLVTGLITRASQAFPIPANTPLTGNVLVINGEPIITITTNFNSQTFNLVQNTVISDMFGINSGFLITPSNCNGQLAFRQQ